MANQHPKNPQNPKDSADGQSPPEPGNSLDFQEEYLRHELSKIDKMTIQDLLITKRKHTTPLQDIRRQSNLVRESKQLNDQFGIKERYMGERSPGEVWTNIDQQVTDMRAVDFQEQRVSKTLNALKRGRLGIDLYLIAFATLGVIAVPLYFYFVGKKGREKRVKSRILKPKQIRQLDEDSAFNIDEVSEQVIQYYNPERERMALRQMQLAEEREHLLKELQDV